MDGIDYEKRIKMVEDAAFERAVTRATAQVAQNLARIHRRRLVTQTAASVTAIVAAIAIGIGFLIQGNNNATRSANISTNCAVVQTITSTLADFVRGDADLLKRQQQVNPDVLAGFHKILSNKTLRTAIKRSADENNATITHWLKVDVPQLYSLSQRLHCQLK